MQSHYRQEQKLLVLDSECKDISHSADVMSTEKYSKTQADQNATNVKISVLKQHCGHVADVLQHERTKLTEVIGLH